MSDAIANRVVFIPLLLLGMILAILLSPFLPVLLFLLNGIGRVSVGQDSSGIEFSTIEYLLIILVAAGVLAAPFHYYKMFSLGSSGDFWGYYTSTVIPHAGVVLLLIVVDRLINPRYNKSGTQTRSSPSSKSQQTQMRSSPSDNSQQTNRTDSSDYTGDSDESGTPPTAGPRLSSYTRSTAPYSHNHTQHDSSEGNKRRRKNKTNSRQSSDTPRGCVCTSCGAYFSQKSGSCRMCGSTQLEER